MKVVYTKAITKDVKKIKDKKLQIQIEKAIVLLKETESIHKITSIKKMAAHPNAYRMRIGDYRLGFYLDGKTIILACFTKRNDIYKIFP